jgi:hypothetical protein
MGKDHWFLVGDKPSMFIKRRFRVHQCNKHIIPHFLPALHIDFFEGNTEERFESALEKLGNVEATA